MMPADAPDAAAPPGLEQAFSQLGLTSTERRAYTFLLGRGTATPTQIADATGQSRGRIYETLRLLVERGLAREEPRRPVRYSPVPPGDVVAGALESAQRHAYALRDAYAGLARLVPPPAATVPATKASDLAVLAGRPAVTAEIRRLVQRAREVVHLEGRANLARRLENDKDLTGALRDARRRGAQVRVHLGPGVAADVRKNLEGILGNGTIVATASPPNLTTLLTESAVLVVLPQPDDDGSEGDDVGHRAESPALVKAMRERFEGTGQARPHARPSTPSAAVEEAQRSLDVLGHEAWGADLFRAEESTLQALRRARARGVTLRLLLTDPNAARSVPPELAAVAEVRTAAWVPARLALVDGQVHHFGPEATDVRVSNEAPEVRFYRDLFERLWSDAGGALRS